MAAGLARSSALARWLLVVGARRRIVAARVLGAWPPIAVSRPEAPAMLELRGRRRYRYAGLRAARRSTTWTCVLGDGEIVGLVGGNETGKSTICLVASGLAPVVDRRRAERRGS